MATSLIMKQKCILFDYNKLSKYPNQKHQFARCIFLHMLRYRRQVELAFAHESNQLDSVVYGKITKRVHSFFIMRDMFRLIKRIIKHVRDTILPKNHCT